LARSTARTSKSAKPSRSQFLLFGLRTEQVAQAREAGYDPMQRYYAEPVLARRARRVARACSHRRTNRFKPIVDSLLHAATLHGAGRLLDYVPLPAQRRSRYHDQVA